MDTVMKKSTVIKKLCVKVIAEDSVGYDTPYLGQHGISLLLSAEHANGVYHVLVDVAQDAAALLENFKRMDISLSCVDAVVLTHCHYDHTQGVAKIIRKIGKKDLPIIAHPDLFRNHFISDPFLRPIGVMDGDRKSDIEAAGGSLYLTGDPLNILPGLMTTGEIPRITEFEEVGMSLYRIENGKVKKDTMIDDLSVVANVEGKGLIVVTGCSHAGIVNIAHHAMKLNADEKIYAIIGGFHLIEASEQRIQKTALELKKIGPKYVYAGHCTGFKAQMALYNAFKDQFVPLYTGLSLEIR
jgi:7,8-dihydropterin-6-yl-methyl-4-(beta-D-ribofuranosyl)aminobenzene 5'-phosphate synthase